MPETQLSSIFHLGIWTAIGLIGSALYFSRLILQWWLSEKAGKPVIPAIYWYLSVFGALILTIYAYKQKDLVFLLNYLVPLAIYIRQVVLHHRSHKPVASTEKLCPHCGKQLQIESNL